MEFLTLKFSKNNMSKLFKKAGEYKQEKINFLFEEKVLNSSKKFLIIERSSKKEKLMKYKKFQSFIENNLEHLLEQSVMKMDNKIFNFTEKTKKIFLLHLLKVGVNFMDELEDGLDDEDDLDDLEL